MTHNRAFTSSKTLLVFGAAFCLAGCIGGCVSTTTTTHGSMPASIATPSRRSPSNASSNVQTRSAPSQTPVQGSDLTAVTDPSADRLGNIISYMLLYDAANGHLPAQLEDLATVIPEGQTLSVLSPVSQQLYVYNPAGLQVPGQSARLILYDPVPGNHGMRWGVIARDASPGHSLEMAPVHLTAKQFSAYRPAIAPAPK